MMQANGCPTLVLQRRIDRPLGAVEQVICNPRLARAGSQFALDDLELIVKLERAFGVIVPLFALQGASWSAPAVIFRRRGHRLEAFDLELNRWDADSTELLVRPQASRLDHWSERRLRRYFVLAHATADRITRFLAAEAREPLAARALSILELVP